MFCLDWCNGYQGSKYIDVYTKEFNVDRIPDYSWFGFILYIKEMIVWIGCYSLFVNVRFGELCEIKAS